MTRVLGRSPREGGLGRRKVCGERTLTRDNPGWALSGWSVRPWYPIKASGLFLYRLKGSGLWNSPLDLTSLCVCLSLANCCQEKCNYLVYAANVCWLSHPMSTQEGLIYTLSQSERLQALSHLHLLKQEVRRLLKCPWGISGESPEMCFLHSLSPASPRTQHVVQPLLRHPWPTKPPEEAPRCLGRQSPPQDSHVLATAVSRVLQGLETCSSRGAAQIWGEQPPSRS